MTNSHVELCCIFCYWTVWLCLSTLTEMQTLNLFYLIIIFRSILHGPNGQTLSPEDVVKAGALDSPSGLDFSGDTYPVRILYVLAGQWQSVKFS